MGVDLVALFEWCEFLLPEDDEATGFSSMVTASYQTETKVDLMISNPWHFGISFFVCIIWQLGRCDLAKGETGKRMLSTAEAVRL